MNARLKIISQFALKSLSVLVLCSGIAYAQNGITAGTTSEPAMELPNGSAIQPENNELSPPQSGTANAQSGQSAGDEFGENLFFDAEALVPQSELSRKGAPVRVDPVLSPGTTLVVAKKKFNPGSKQARLVAADRAMKLGRFESALEIYDGLYASNKRDPNILMGRAVALQRIGQDNEALLAYEELLELRPQNIEAKVNMHGLMAKRFPSVALRNLRELHQQNPGSVSIMAQLAIVEAQLGKHVEAIRFLGMAASMEPENAGHIFNMAVIADRAGDKTKAIQYYEDALEIDTLYGSGKTVPRELIYERLASLR